MRKQPSIHQMPNPNGPGSEIHLGSLFIVSRMDVNPPTLPILTISFLFFTLFMQKISGHWRDFIGKLRNTFFGFARESPAPLSKNPRGSPGAENMAKHRNNRASRSANHRQEPEIQPIMPSESISIRGIEYDSEDPESPDVSLPVNNPVRVSRAQRTVRNHPNESTRHSKDNEDDSSYFKRPKRDGIRRPSAIDKGKGRQQSDTEPYHVESEPSRGRSVNARPRHTSKPRRGTTQGVKSSCPEETCRKSRAEEERGPGVSVLGGTQRSNNVEEDPGTGDRSETRSRPGLRSVIQDELGELGSTDRAGTDEIKIAEATSTITRDLSNKIIENQEEIKQIKGVLDLLCSSVANIEQCLESTTQQKASANSGFRQASASTTSCESLGSALIEALLKGIRETQISINFGSREVSHETKGCTCSKFWDNSSFTKASSKNLPSANPAAHSGSEQPSSSSSPPSPNQPPGLGSNFKLKPTEVPAQVYPIRPPGLEPYD